MKLIKWPILTFSATCQDVRHIDFLRFDFLFSVNMFLDLKVTICSNHACTLACVAPRYISFQFFMHINTNHILICVTLVLFCTLLNQKMVIIISCIFNLLYNVICFFSLYSNFRMQNFYENFLHESFIQD